MTLLKNIKIKVANNSYPIVLGNNILKIFINFIFVTAHIQKKVLFVSNSQIPNKYLKTIRASLPKKLIITL